MVKKTQLTVIFCSSSQEERSLRPKISKPFLNGETRADGRDEERRKSAENSSCDESLFSGNRVVRALDNQRTSVSQSTSSLRNRDDGNDTLSTSTLPSDVRISNVRHELSKEPKAPLHFFHQQNRVLLKDDPRAHSQYQSSHSPVRVMAPGYSQLHENWTLRYPYYSNSPAMAYSTSSFGNPLSTFPSSTRPILEESSVREAASSSSIDHGLNFGPTNVLSPRSMSLSECSTSSRHSESFSIREPDKNDVTTFNIQSKIKPNMTQSVSGTLSPFDSGNDSGKSFQAGFSSKRHQSLTLV